MDVDNGVGDKSGVGVSAGLGSANGLNMLMNAASTTPDVEINATMMAVLSFEGFFPAI